MKVYDSQGRLKVVGFTGPPGTQSVTCAELSATASVLSGSIQVASAAATSVDARVNSVNTALSGISARSAGGVSTHGIQSVVDALSNRISGIVAGTGSVTSAEVQVASAAATSADLHAAAASAAATSADNHANTVSARVVSVSAELASLVQIASAAATSADAHASAASAAATSADAHANTVSARAVSISAELASLVQIASAAATSADNHANTVSARAVSISAELASLVQIASAAATSVDARIASLSAGFASLSGRSAGDASTHGLQSIINALSNRISGVTGGAGSVTSNELSAGLVGLRRSIDLLQLKNEDGLDVSAGSPVFLATSAASAFHVAAGQDLDIKEAIGMATTTIAVGATGDIQTRGILSLTSAQWDARTGQTGGLTIGSKYYLAITPGDLSLAPAFDAARVVGVAIAADKMLLGFNLVDDAKPFISAVSARAVGDASTHGLQSVVNALSGRIAAASASVTSQEMSVRVQVASAAATSADNHANTASAAATSADAHANTVSARVVSVSAELASLVQIASAAATSADAHANTASAAATSVDARIASLSAGFASLSVRSVGNVSTHGFQSIFNALSNRISAGGGTGSVTSNEISVIRDDLLVRVMVNFTGDSVRAGTPVYKNISDDDGFELNTPGLSSPVIGLVADASIAFGVSGNVRIGGILTLSASAWDVVRPLDTGGLRMGAKYYVGSAPGTIHSLPASAGAARPVGVAWSVTEMLIKPGLVDQATGGTGSVTSAEHASVDARVNSVNTFLSGISARSIGDVSTHGVQSVVDLLSARIQSALASATQAQAVAAAVGNQVSVLSTAHTSTDGRVTSINARICAISALQQGGTPVEGLQSAIDAQSGKISALIAASTAGSIAALSNAISNDASVSAVIKADINSVSAAIMADAASHLASTSAAIKADINSVSAAIRADEASHIASTSAEIINEVSVQFGRGQFRRITTGAQAIATATFTKVSGLSLSIVGSGFYEIHGQLVWSQSGAAAASAIFNFGMSMTAQPTMAAFRMMGNTQNFAASASIAASVLPFQLQFGGASAICATPSIMYSAKPNPGASASVAVTMFFDGVLAASTVQSQLKVVVACSTGAFGVAIQPGSYIRAFRIG